MQRISQEYFQQNGGVQFSFRESAAHIHVMIDIAAEKKQRRKKMTQRGFQVCLRAASAVLKHDEQHREFQQIKQNKILADTHMQHGYDQ